VDEILHVLVSIILISAQHATSLAQIILMFISKKYNAKNKLSEMLLTKVEDSNMMLMTLKVSEMLLRNRALKTW